MKKEILFIDDEEFFADPYARELGRLFQVHIRYDAQSGLAAFHANKKLAAIVLDIMMPPPAGASPLVLENGLRTGLWLLEQMKTELLQRRIPTVVLTNRSFSLVQECIKEMAFPEGLIVVRPKIETPRFVLPNIVDALVNDKK